jgi:DNA-binding response OmpR family regulator
VVTKAQQAPVNGERVLWIDDDVASDSAAVRLLEAEGFCIKAAQSGADGLGMVERLPFDAILLDLRLPDEHGLEVLQKLVRLTTVPVGILTAYGEPQTAVAAIKLGAADYREKRLIEDSLPLFVRDLVRRGPREAPQLAEVEWIGVQLGRLSPTLRRDEIARLLLAVLLSRRVSLRFHLVVAEALHNAMRPGGSVVSLIADIHEQFTRVRTGSWTTHPVLLAGLAELEGDAVKQSQRVFGRRIPLSRSYFSHRMTVETGRSPAAWCRAAVLRRGLRLVMETGEAVSQIAYACGYDHHSQFDREFTAMYGAAPRALRALYGRRPQSTHGS